MFSILYSRREKSFVFKKVKIKIKIHQTKNKNLYKKAETIFTILYVDRKIRKI